MHSAAKKQHRLLYVQMLKNQHTEVGVRQPHLAACGKAHHTFAAAHLHGLVLRLPLVRVATCGNELITLQTRIMTISERQSVLHGAVYQSSRIEQSSA